MNIFQLDIHYFLRKILESTISDLNVAFLPSRYSVFNINPFQAIFLFNPKGKKIFQKLHYRSKMTFSCAALLIVVKPLLYVATMFNPTNITFIWNASEPILNPWNINTLRRDFPVGGTLWHAIFAVLKKHQDQVGMNQATNRKHLCW